jgi:16S rRNA (cytosine1402-N4)-methyltransferase
MFDCLNVGGRLSIITFHSLEDRIVKTAFAEFCSGCTCPPDFPVCVCGNKPRGSLVFRKPVTASQDELDNNTRSSCAKLRVIEKL